MTILKINRMHVKLPDLSLSSSGARFVVFTLVYIWLSYTLVYSFGAPRLLLYIDDILVALNFLYALIQKRGLSCAPKPLLCMILFCIFGIFSSFINTASVMGLIWGLRNNARIFAFFYACIIFLRKQDIKVIFKLIWFVFWISLPLCVIERFVISYPAGTIIGDMIGGIFWNFSGSNLPLNVIICICIIDVSVKYFKHQQTFTRLILACAAALLMAATAELKVFVIEFAMILIAAALGNGFSLKSIFKIILVVIIFGVAANLFLTYFISLNSTSSAYAEIFTVDGFWEYLTRDTGYTGSGDLNRFTGIVTVAEDIFEGNWIKILFGIGLGNAEYNNFFQSAFYGMYGHLNYQWFQLIWTFIETGIIGLLLYILILIFVLYDLKFFNANKSVKKSIKITVLLMFILFVYNITLRSETGGFLLFTLLAIPYIYKNDKSEISSEVA